MIDEADPLETFRKEWEAYRAERNLRLRKFFIKVMVIFALLGVTMSATVAYVYYNAKLNTEALCSIRADAERRVALGDEFLDSHPNGTAEISAEVLQRSVDSSRSTVKSLSNLDCDSSVSIVGS